MRDTDDLQTTITLGPVNREGQTLSLELELQMTLPMPDQDEHLPDQIEAFVHQAGLEVQRRLFRALIEKADQELVLQRRHGKGGGGIQRRGTRPFTFKTTFGEVTVRRSRIRHKRDGTMEIPSATAWDTPHQLAITRNLRDAVCDQMSDQSAGKSRADVCQYAGDEDLLGRSTILEIVHQEGERLIAAQRAARPRDPGRRLRGPTGLARSARGRRRGGTSSATSRRATIPRRPRPSGSRPRPSGRDGLPRV